MIGYLKPKYKEMPSQCKKEYRSIYCGLCHTLKKECSLIGISCLNYEITIFLIILLGLRENKVRTFHGSCTLSPFIMVPFVDYLNSNFSLGAKLSILIAGYEVADNVIDEGKIRWKIANSLLKKYIKVTEQLLPDVSLRIKKSLKNFYELEGATDIIFSDLFTAAGELVKVIMEPLFIDCSRIDKLLLLYLAECLGRWIYLIDDCDDAKEDKKNGQINSLNLLDEPSSIRLIIRSIESEIADCVYKLPLKHYRCLIEYLLIENISKTSERIISKYESEL